jgi:tetratricopeptide (TPR) repeat protein
LRVFAWSAALVAILSLLVSACNGPASPSDPSDEEDESIAMHKPLPESYSSELVLWSYPFTWATSSEEELTKAYRAIEEALASEKELGGFYSALGRLSNELDQKQILAGKEPFDHPEIEEYLKKAIQEHPWVPGTYRILADYYKNRGRYDKAIEMHGKAYEEKAVSLIDYSFNVGGLLRLTGSLVEAEKHLQTALAGLAQNPADEDVRSTTALVKWELGQIYLKLEQTEKAEAQFLESAELMADGGGAACAHSSLGQLYAATDRKTEAARIAREGAELEPTAHATLHLAAKTHFSIGEYEIAEEYLDKAMAIQETADYLDMKRRIKKRYGLIGKGKDADLRRALILFQEYDFSTPYKTVSRKIAEPGDSRWFVLAGMIDLMNKRYDQARTMFSTAETKKQIAGAMAGLGHLAIIDKDYESADLRFAQAFEALPAKVARTSDEDRLLVSYDWFVFEMATLGKAWSLSNRNRHKQAMRLFDQVLSHQPDDRFAMLGKANSLTAFGDLGGAEALLQKVLDQDEKNPYALAELAMVKLRLGQVEAAESGFRMAAKEGAEGYTCPFEGLGILYMKQGKVELAKKNFEKAIELNPEIEYRKFNGLARIHIEKGEYETARGLLEKSIENYPYDPEAKKLLLRIQDLSSSDKSQSKLLPQAAASTDPA